MGVLASVSKSKCGVRHATEGGYTFALTTTTENVGSVVN